MQIRYSKHALKALLRSNKRRLIEQKINALDQAAPLQGWDLPGLQLAFARQEGAPLRSVAIAQGKAYSAARMGSTTRRPSCHTMTGAYQPG